MVYTVDARGLACPQPVIQTRKALQASDAITTIVDNETAQHNVTRMAEKAGYTVQAEEQDDGIYLHITGGGSVSAEGTVQAISPSEQPVGRVIPMIREPRVLVVSSEYMGRGEHAELGTVLIRAFFHTLGEVDPVPDTIVFSNSGVKLVVEGSPVVFFY